MSEPKIGVERADVSLFGPMVKQLTDRIIPLTPSRVTPNQITIAGFIVALTGAMAFSISGSQPAWLWVAALALLVYGVGDSLDGELARARKLVSQRGFFLDIFLDDLSFCAIYLGIALSGYVHFPLATLVIIVHLLSDCVVTLGIHLKDRHVIPTLGPTEVCVLLAIAAGATFFLGRSGFSFGGYSLSLFDLLFLVGGVYGFIDMLISAHKLNGELSGPAPSVEA